MPLINNLFDRLVTRNKKLIGHWASVYLDYTNEMNLISSRLVASPAMRLDNPALFTGTSVSNYNDFIYKWIYEHNNGISSTGLSLLSVVNFDKIRTSASFKTVARKVIAAPDFTNYCNLNNQWHTIIGRNNPLRTNRALATCNPKELASTVDWSKFCAVLTYLRKHCSYTITNPAPNWFVWNQELTKWLDSKLSVERSTYTDRKKYYVDRNIFVWMLYENDPLTPADKKYFL